MAGPMLETLSHKSSIEGKKAFWEIMNLTTKEVQVYGNRALIFKAFPIAFIHLPVEGLVGPCRAMCEYQFLRRNVLILKYF